MAHLWHLYWFTAIAISILIFLIGGYTYKRAPHWGERVLGIGFILIAICFDAGVEVMNLHP